MRFTDSHFVQLVAATKAFRDAWEGILSSQISVAAEFETLYKPLEVTEGNQGSITPQQYLTKTGGLRATYARLQADLRSETEMIDAKLLRPATEARNSILLLKPVIKKREDCKLDYERFHSRVEHAQKKDIKSPKEEAALARHEMDLADATAVSLVMFMPCTHNQLCIRSSFAQEYAQADAKLKHALPPVIAAVSNLMPYILATQILLQHTLVAQLYTVLHGFCQKVQMPSPAPPVEQIVATFEAEFTPLRNEIESSMMTIANGKAIHQPMALPDAYTGSTLTGLNLRNRAIAGGKSLQQPSSPDGSGGSSMTGLGLRNKVMAGGKSIHGAVAQPSSPDGTGSSSVTGLNLRGKFTARRSSSQNSIPQIASSPHGREAALMEEEEAPPARPPRPDSFSMASRPRIGSGRSTPSTSIPGTPYGIGSLPVGGSPTGLAQMASNGSRGSSGSTPKWTPPGHAAVTSPVDYFTSGRQAMTPSMASSIAGKKKPPPPPPKKMPSQYVTALYDFAGQGEGDLSFREGEQIRVVKKTESTDDWWQGELHGTQGSFPANYVR